MRSYFKAAFALLLLPSAALADQSADTAACQQAAGSLLTGTVVRGPTFRSGNREKGVFLSHTHVTLRGDDGTRYDVAIDNVFAAGYRRNRRQVPAPLNTIRVGDRLELCGQMYSGGDIGIHWVHTNCGATPTPDKPNGWVRRIGTDGTAGPNMESNQAFCGLSPQ